MERENTGLLSELTFNSTWIIVFKFGNKDEWILRQTCILVIILVFIISDFVYFLWFFTLRFTFPKEILDPIKKAIFGSIDDLKSFAKSKAMSICLKVASQRDCNTLLNKVNSME